MKNILFFLTPKAMCAHLHADYTLRQNVSMEKRMDQKAALDGKIGYID